MFCNNTQPNQPYPIAYIAPKVCNICLVVYQCLRLTDGHTDRHVHRQTQLKQYMLRSTSGALVISTILTYIYVLTRLVYSACLRSQFLVLCLIFHLVEWLESVSVCLRENKKERKYSSRQQWPILHYSFSWFREAITWDDSILKTVSSNSVSDCWRAYYWLRCKQNALLHVYEYNLCSWRRCRRSTAKWSAVCLSYRRTSTSCAPWAIRLAATTTKVPPRSAVICLYASAGNDRSYL